MSNEGWSPKPRRKMGLDGIFSYEQDAPVRRVRANRWKQQRDLDGTPHTIPGPSALTPPLAGPKLELEGLNKAKSFKPPQAVRSAAKRGLEMRKKHGRGGLDNKEASKQGIGSGVQRASDLANGENVSLDTVKRMHAFFSRHQKNKGKEGDTSAGRIAWLLWGGDAGRSWAKKILDQEEKDGKVSKATSGDDAPDKDPEEVVKAFLLMKSSHTEKDKDEAEKSETRAMAAKIDRASKKLLNAAGKGSKCKPEELKKNS